MIHHLKFAGIFLVVICVLMGAFYKILPSTFVPSEDQGFFMASIKMPEGTSPQSDNQDSRCHGG